MARYIPRQPIGRQVANTASNAYGDPIIMGAMIGTLFIVAYGDYKDGEFPPPPKTILATLAVFGILGLVTITDNRIGKSFAVLILIGVAIKKLPGITGGKKGKAVTDKTVPFQESQRTAATFDFPQANPVGSNKHKIGKKKQPKGQQQK